MTKGCVPEFVGFSIGSQRSEARGCANGYLEVDLIRITMFLFSVKVVIEVASTSLRVRLDGPLYSQ